MADYQKKNTYAESQLQMLEKITLSFEEHLALISYCKDVGVNYLTTAFDFPSIDFVETLKLPYWKIPSGEINNLSYLRKIGSFGKPIILSTGMATMDEIQQALSILIESGTSLEKIIVLQCNTEYPTPYQDANLLAMLTIKEKFNVKVGYSDHTLGIEVPIAATALGATVIEKHFTLDKTMEGPDHKASIEPEELKSMVRSIRHIELSLGNGIKKPTKSEARNIPIARRSIYAKIDIKEGEIFSSSNLTLKRPGTGLSPMQWDFVIGQKARKKFSKDELIVL